MAEIPANDFLIGARVKPAMSRDDIIMRAGIVLFIGFLAVAVALPLWALLSKSFENRGEFVGLANYIRYFSTPALFASVWNSFYVAMVTTAIVLPLAFIYAYALTRSDMRWKGLFQALALIALMDKCKATTGNIPGPLMKRRDL